MHRQRGFSLLEIVVVIVLIAIMATVIAMSVTGGLDSARVRSASRDVAAALRYTRGQAIVHHEQRTLAFNVDERSYRMPDKEPVQLPRGMEMELLTAQSEMLSDGEGQIRFYPDGSSGGGRVTLIRGEARWEIEVEWLTGKVRLLDPADDRDARR